MRIFVPNGEQWKEKRPTLTYPGDKPLVMLMYDIIRDIINSGDLRQSGKQYYIVFNEEEERALREFLHPVFADMRIVLKEGKLTRDLTLSTLIANLAAAVNTFFPNLIIMGDRIAEYSRLIISEETGPIHLALEVKTKT